GRKIFRLFPGACLDHFDQAYKEDCRHGEFSDRYLFNHERKRCEHFHWGGCQSSSENFFLSVGGCRDLCEEPARELSRKFSEAMNTRIFMQFKYGNCRGTSQNIFPTLDLCEWTCERRRDERIPGIPSGILTFLAYCVDEFDPAYKESCEGGQWRERAYFDDMRRTTFFQILRRTTTVCCQRKSEPAKKHTEMDCYMPLDQGSGVNDKNCAENAGFRFYFSKEKEKCLRFWYNGCGGNSNNFYSYEVCQRSCRTQEPKLERKPRASSRVCFLPPGDKGECPGNANHTVQRWTYTANQKCAQFTYSGCGGSGNRLGEQIYISAMERLCLPGLVKALLGGF
ncbi:Kunitz/Bovine pancreatic trypsin inhibitor domain protein, partial [Oesophagostomum dentatum]